jgi:transposase
MYRVEQRIKGTIYVYQVTSYWDKKKQQARQRRTCIGKKDPVTGELIPSKSNTPPRASRDFGNYYLLKSIADKVGITDILARIFPDIWKEILTCCFYEISERKPLYLCEQWSELTQTIDNTILSSPRISELVQDLGHRDRDRMEFFTEWARHRAEHEYLAFDITSISSYSKIIEYLEYGYNRDGENLPQINLGMLFGETSLLPIFYSIHQGSIRDMKTLSNLISYTEHLNIQKVRFVMDKGFYSESNIREMTKKGVKFAISVPFTTLFAKSLVDAVRKTITAPANSFSINGDIIYATKSKIKHHGSHVHAFVYYNEHAYIDAKESLLKRIMSLELQLSQKKSLPSGFTDPCLKFLTIRHAKKRLVIRRNEETIAHYLRYKGYVVIISNNLRDAYQTLNIYRSKDVVERAFDNIKNELDLKRLRVHSELAMTGRIFLCFLSLILHSWIDRRMQETHLYKRWTQEEVMYELKRLKIIEFTSRKSILTEISKNQSYIFKVFQIPFPVIT